MQEFRIDHSEFDQLVEKLDETPQVIAEAKRQALEAAAPQLQKLVQNEIGGSGRVRSWQERYVGSKGGYAAVRPRAKTWAASRGMQTYEARLRKPPTYAVATSPTPSTAAIKRPETKRATGPAAGSSRAGTSMRRPGSRRSPWPRRPPRRSFRRSGNIWRDSA